MYIIGINIFIYYYYIPPRDKNNPIQTNIDNDITNCFNYITNLTNSIITADINAHHTTWFSPTIDHRGTLIEELISNSNHIILNQDISTRIPARNQQPTSPDITTATNHIYRNMTWKTLQALNSDHKPIKVTLNTKTKYKLVQHKHTYTNYKKANWDEYTKQIEDNLTDATPPTDVHISNKILTNLILNAEKQFIPKGKINNKLKLLPENIRNTIKARNRIRTQDPQDIRLQRINEEIDRHSTK